MLVMLVKEHTIRGVTFPVDSIYQLVCLNSTVKSLCTSVSLRLTLIDSTLIGSSRERSVEAMAHSAIVVQILVRTLPAMGVRARQIASSCLLVDQIAIKLCLAAFFVWL